MAGGEDQNPASSSPGLTGEVVGSDEGLTTISFWGLDGGEAWPAGVGGGKVAGRALLRCRHDEKVGNETLSRGERESHQHTPMAYISGPAGVVNDSTTPNLTTGDTTHVGAFW
jgi:hypothetical protein